MSLLYLFVHLYVAFDSERGLGWHKLIHCIGRSSYKHQLISAASVYGLTEVFWLLQFYLLSGLKDSTQEEVQLLLPLPHSPC